MVKSYGKILSLNALEVCDVLTNVHCDNNDEYDIYESDSYFDVS